MRLIHEAGITGVIVPERSNAPRFVEYPSYCEGPIMVVVSDENQTMYIDEGFTVVNHIRSGFWEGDRGHLPLRSNGRVIRSMLQNNILPLEYMPRWLAESAQRTFRGCARVKE